MRRSKFKATSDIVVREARPDDRTSIASLVSATRFSPYRTYGVYFAELPALALDDSVAAAQHAVEDPDANVLVAADRSGSLVGAFVARQNDFDRHHLGVPVRRVKILEGPDDPQARRAVASSLLSAALVEYPALYLLDVDAADVHVLAAAQKCGFDVFDTSLTYVTRVPTISDRRRDERFSLAAYDRQRPPDLRPHEIDRMARDSAMSFQESHFFADPRLEHARCARLYDRWARNMLSGEWADWLVVASDDGGPQGALGLRSVPFAEAGGAPRLMGDAFGFSTFPRGRGVGSAMMRFYIREAPCDIIESTTQVRTTPLLISFAQVMRFARAHYVLHGWSTSLALD